MGDTPLLVVNHYYDKFEAPFRKPDLQPDTLVFKLGGFMEYNPWPDNYNVEKIELSTTGCYGPCAIFDMVIDSNRLAHYRATKHNKKKGDFRTVIDKEAYSQLIGTINYIKVDSLKAQYQSTWTDLQTILTGITFNGRNRTVYDYGGIGTFGLRHFYMQMFALRSTQKWKRTKDYFFRLSLISE